MPYNSLDEFLAEYYCKLKDGGVSDRVAEIVESWLRRLVDEEQTELIWLEEELSPESILGYINDLKYFATAQGEEYHPDVDYPDSFDGQLLKAIIEDINEPDKKPDVIEQYLYSHSDLSESQKFAFSLLCHLLSIEYHSQRSSVEDLARESVRAVNIITRR